ncbi:hypothetical protein [Gordonia sp. NPDC003950]
MLMPVLSRLQMRIPSHLLLTVGFVSMAAAIPSLVGLRPGAIREEIVEPNTGELPATGMPAV